MSPARPLCSCAHRVAVHTQPLALDLETSGKRFISSSSHCFCCTQEASRWRAQACSHCLPAGDQRNEQPSRLFRHRGIRPAPGPHRDDGEPDPAIYQPCTPSRVQKLILLRCSCARTLCQRQVRSFQLNCSSCKRWDQSTLTLMAPVAENFRALCTGEPAHTPAARGCLATAAELVLLAQARRARARWASPCTSRAPPSTAWCVLRLLLCPAGADRD